MNKAFIDTTILTDVLVKSGEKKKVALRALKLFNSTLLPVFAIKEFKAGPLNNFVWMHNKLVTVKSFRKALNWLQRMSTTPKRYTTSTAIQALEEAAGSIGKNTPASLQKKYGKTASLDSILYDEFRLTLKVAIMKAWKNRRKVTTDITNALPCYKESPPYEKRGLIDLEPKKCTLSQTCSLGPLLKKKPDELIKLRDAIINSDKPELMRCSRVLRKLMRKPKDPILHKECRNLGDSLFAFFSPEDAIILTTNTRDHKPLAEALSKKASSPQDLLE